MKTPDERLNASGCFGGTSAARDCRETAGRRPGRGPRRDASELSRPSGIIETGEGFISSISSRLTLTVLFGSSMSGLTENDVAGEVDDPAGDDPAVGRGDGHGLVLVADRLAGQDDRFEQVADAEPAGDAREVGAQPASLVVEAVAGRSTWPRRRAFGRGRSRGP